MLPADDREASAGIFVMAMSLKAKLCHSLFEIMFTSKEKLNNLVAEKKWRRIQMTLPQFLKQVNGVLEKMPEEELRSFIIDVAQSLPEGRRDSFLRMMKNAKGLSHKTGENPGAKTVHDEVEKMIKVLQEIEEGERCLDSEYNEEYDDWYASDEDEVLFMDGDRILPDVEEAISLLHKCIDTEQYEDGYKLAEQLSITEVSATGDWADYEGSPLGINELYDHGLLDGSFDNMVNESMFLAYIGNDISERAEAMFRLYENLRPYSFQLKKVIELGGYVLPEFDKFIVDWSNILGTRNGWGIKDMLKEAQSMLKDDNQILENARKHTDNHPELYKEILVNGVDSGEDSRMLDIGEEALKKIPNNYKVRADVALLTAEYAYKNNQKSFQEYCWLEAFSSDTTFTNFFRLLMKHSNYSAFAKTIHKECEDEYEKFKNNRNTTVYRSGMPEENDMGRNDYLAVKFFEGDFETVIKSGMSEKAALGWSSTFMKQGIALFMMLLYKGETLPSGLGSMLNMAVSGIGFDAEKYYKGLGEYVDEPLSSTDTFYELFDEWKSGIKVNESDYKKWMKMLGNLIEQRTAGIMGANRRNYYGECASFIAAYGEVAESRGITKKATILEKYRNEYSRRRAFIQALRNFGLKK